MKKIIDRSAIILTIISFVALLVAHFAMYFEADDLYYSTNLVTGEPLASIADIIQGQIWHYSNWGGRVIAHFILQLTLLLGQVACNILNTVVTAILLIIICKLADIKGSTFYFLSFSILFGSMVSMKTSLMWQSGAANYLYMSIIVFSFLALFLRLDDDKPNLPLMFIWMPILGLLAGWSNENLGPAIWILTVLICICCKKRGNKIPLWAILSSITCLIGSIILIIAPGNYVRSATSTVHSFGLGVKLFIQVFNEGTGLFHAMFIILLTAAFIFIIGKYACNINVGRKRIYMLVGAVLSFGALIVSPAYTDRAYYAPTLFLIIFSLSYTKDIKEKREDLFLPLLIPYMCLWLRAMYLLLAIGATAKGWV